MLVGAVVVDDQVDVEILRDGLPDLAEEAEELLVPVARLALGQHLPVAKSRAANRLVVPWRM